MQLKSFGDSFIFGTDLDDANDGSTQLLIQPSQKTWPARLAQHLGYDYECHAWPGLGHLQIAERVLNHLECDPALFVISWSWIDRFDHRPDGLDLWNTIRPTCEDSHARYYYKHFHSQYTDKLNTLIYIKTCQDLLKQHGHSMIMTYMDDLIFETEWHNSAAITQLQNSIRTHMTAFAGTTFLTWAQDQNFAINEHLHPGEDAHAAATQLLISQGLL